MQTRGLGGRSRRFPELARERNWAGAHAPSTVERSEMEAAARRISRANLLSSAAALGNEAEVQKLLDEGADPNGVNSYGRTAIQVESPGLLLLPPPLSNNPSPSFGLVSVDFLASQGVGKTRIKLLSHGVFRESEWQGPQRDEEVPKSTHSLGAGDNVCIA